MPAQTVPDAEQTALRERLAAGGNWNSGSTILGERIAKYASDHPLHVAAVDANAVRCEVHALALAAPEAIELQVVARVFDVGATLLDDYASAVGL